jgi:glucose/arabinose dehydrogenase
VGLDFGPDGSMYVGEMLRDGFRQFARRNLTGSVIRRSPDGTRTELARGRLQAVGGVAVGPDGAVYVSTNSVFPGRGQIVRIAPSWPLSDAVRYGRSKSAACPCPTPTQSVASP